MRRLLICVVLPMIFTAFSCSKDSLESIPLQVSFETPDIALESYVAKLNESSEGWEFGLTSNNSGYNVGYLDFENANSAFVVISEAAREESTASAYRCTVSGGNPTISFPSGTFAAFAMANAGLDTSFTFRGMRQDSVFLLGNQYGNQLVLAKASTVKAQAYRADGIQNTSAALGRLMKLPKYFKRLVVNGASYDVQFRPDLKTAYIQYGGTERFKIHETAYSITATGISFQKPLVDGINIISYIDAFTVSESGELSATINGVPVPFTNEAAPSAYDVNAPVYFQTHPFHENLWSGCYDGFTVDGVPDAYGIKTITGFRFMVLFHRLADEGENAQFAGLQFYVGDTFGDYGPAVAPQFSTPPGMMRFLYAGNFGNPPEEIKDIVTNVINAFTDTSGYYVIKSGSSAYDLVSVADGRKWIRFE
ncbi:protein of unknown function [bacterium A37T11]|nr:protein of unknown function [bacterium A37T11]